MYNFVETSVETYLINFHFHTKNVETDDANLQSPKTSGGSSLLAKSLKTPKSKEQRQIELTNFPADW
jgi:hypothetical protein